MARHTNGQFNFKVAAGPIVIALVVTLVACLVWFWNVQRDAATRAHEEIDPCKDRQVMLMVAGTLTPELAELLTAFDKTRPVVDGHCVRTMTTADVHKASVIVQPGTPGLIDTSLGELGATASTGNEWPVGYSRAIGVGYLPSSPPADNLTWTDFAALNVALPSLPLDSERSVAALRLADGDKDKAIRWIASNKDLTLPMAVTLKRPLVALAETELPEGYRFVQPEPATRIPFYVVPLAHSPAVSVEQEKAGQAFTSFVAARTAGDFSATGDAALLDQAAAVTAATLRTDPPVDAAVEPPVNAAAVPPAPGPGDQPPAVPGDNPVQPQPR